MNKLQPNQFQPSPLQRAGLRVSPASRHAARARRAIGLVSFAALALVAGCAGGGGSGASNSGALPGTVLTNPTTGKLFLVDDNAAGATTSLRIVETYWGRLVDVYDVDSTAEVLRDFVISEDIDTDGINYRLERDPLTERDKLTILFQTGTPEFQFALQQAEANLQVMLKKGLDPAELPPFTSVPRNAAMVLRFNDVLDDGGSPATGNLTYPGSVSDATLEVLTGYSPTQPYEARILPDPNH
ncbi:MAG: hypothetical protein NTV21_10300, partial [Planctomycetota bacterium]|nr:hypothetical protein [Planctomycetota bacterium]